MNCPKTFLFQKIMQVYVFRYFVGCLAGEVSLPCKDPIAQTMDKYTQLLGIYYPNASCSQLVMLLPVSMISLAQTVYFQS